MKKSLMLATLFSFVLSGTAVAFHCPRDVATIDAALAENPNLSGAVIARVTELRDAGDAYHKAGKHQDAVDTLAEALAILGVSTE